ncbi:MAG: hypothetical protein ACR2F6_15755 [Mycobacteriales bacterium]
MVTTTATAAPAYPPPGPPGHTVSPSSGVGSGALDDSAYGNQAVVGACLRDAPKNATVPPLRGGLALTGSDATLVAGVGVVLLAGGTFLIVACPRGN